MADYLRTQFTVASHLNDEQKRTLERARLQDAQARAHLKEAMDQRDREIAELRAKQAAERQEIVEQELRKRLPEKADLRLEMRGGRAVSPREKAQRIRHSVEEQWRAKHDRDLEEARLLWNQRIDRTLASAQAREKPAARRQAVSQNSRDITAPGEPRAAHERPDNAHRETQEAASRDAVPERDLWQEVQERRARARERERAGRSRDGER